MQRDKIKPILFSIIKHSSKEELRHQIPKDIVSGVVVAVVALPLSIALAIASGVGPERGLYTAIIAGFLIAFLGGSRVQISGPTAAFATIVAGVVATDGMEGLVAATIIAGVMLVLMGLLKLGTLIRFVPYTITTGFTAGIAVTILVGQIKDLLGLTYPAGTATIDTTDKLGALAANISTVNWQAVLVGVVCLAILMLWPKVSKRIPGSLVAVIAGAGMVHAAVLLLVLVFLMPYAALIPMPTIAAILLQVAYNMSGWRNFAHLCATASRGAVATLLLTFTLTIVFDLVTAIAVGMLITVVLFMKMVSEETEVKGWTYFCDKDSEVTHLRELPKSVRVYEINGPMFFGMTDRISDISVKDFTKYLIIRMRGVPSLDATGMNALENLYEYCAENGVQLIFSHANEQPMRTMRRAGFVDLVGEECFRPNIDDAIAYARTQL